jgi:2-deoxy-D-gluconate 3-dehydrogenase
LVILDAFNLAGHKAIVTGGGGAIGRAMAEALYEAGADIAVISRSEKADVAAANIAHAGRPVFAIRADLGDRQALERGFHEAVEALGGLDILVACHGIIRPDDSLDYDMELWDRHLEVNLTSVFRLCQLAGQRMVAQGRGKIINVASLLSFSGGWRVAAYAASKGGVAQITRALANEWASKGVNVNAIAPGYVRTSLNEHIWKDPARSQEILARLPAGRWGEPDDFKGAVVFLASPASDYLHGVILPVDGGWLAR